MQVIIVCIQDRNYFSFLLAGSFELLETQNFFAIYHPFLLCLEIFLCCVISCMVTREFSCLIILLFVYIGVVQVFTYLLSIQVCEENKQYTFCLMAGSQGLDQKAQYYLYIFTCILDYLFYSREKQVELSMDDIYLKKILTFIHC